jgi:hypothetical protein
VLRDLIVFDEKARALVWGVIAGAKPGGLEKQ